MASNCLVPRKPAVVDIFSMLYGVDIDVEETSVADLSGTHVATFINDYNELVGVCCCDPAFVGFSGAALSMVPAAGVKDMIAAKQFNQVVLDNFYEVMNISTRLIMSADTPHLKLKATLLPEKGKVPRELLEPIAERYSFILDFPKYGKGVMTFLLT